MKINLVEFRNRNKYIIENQHPTLPLIVWSYNDTCQYDKAWDEYTTIARGLITDKEGNIVARPFKKFFNLNEVEETKEENLPEELPKVYDKLDGSLGIQYYDGDKVCIATRSSFIGEQAVWATEWMSEWTKSDFLEGYTYLWEIIYPENRIVVNYLNRKELVLLAVINIEIGEEIADLKEEAKRIGTQTPQMFNMSVPLIIKDVKTLSILREGYVLVYSNGLRVKLKGAEYVRIHKIISHFSVKGIWECCKEGNDLAVLIEGIPDELYREVMDIANELKEKYAMLEYRAKEVYTLIRDYPDRKSQAIFLQRYEGQVKGIVFAMLSGKDCSALIWKYLRP